MQQIPQPSDSSTIVRRLDFDGDPSELGEVFRRTKADVVYDGIVIELLDDIFVG